MIPTHFFLLHLFLKIKPLLLDIIQEILVQEKQIYLFIDFLKNNLYFGKEKIPLNTMSLKLKRMDKLYLLYYSNELINHYMDLITNIKI